MSRRIATLVTLFTLAGGTLLQAADDVILIPIVALGHPGAHGTVWSSSVGLFNSNEHSVDLEGRFSCLFECGSVKNVPAGTSTPVSLEAQPGPPGVLIYATPGSSRQLHFTARVWNRERVTLDAGTTIPVVTEFELVTDESLYLPMIPLDENSRLHLRVYEVGKSEPASVRVRFFTTINTNTVWETVINLNGDGADRFTPQYGELIGLESLLEDVDAFGPGRLLGIEITPLTNGRYWGFASLTNNVTQHVTGFYPDN